MRALVLGLAGIVAGCSQQSGDNTDTQATETVQPTYYQANIAPLFQNACATCHLTGTEAGNMSLVPARAIENIVGVASTEAPGLVRVVPGKPDESYLVMKLEGTHVANGGTGAQMPFGAPPLPAEVIASVRTWIEQGAKP